MRLAIKFLSFLILNICHGNAIAETISADVKITYSAYEKRYDNMFGSMSRPDVFITLSQGNRLFYKSGTIEDAQIFKDSLSVRLTPYENLVLRVWDSDLKSNDLLMENSILMPMHGGENYSFETADSFVPNSLGGVLSVDVRINNSTPNQELVSIKKEIEDVFLEISERVEKHTIADYRIVNSDSVITFKAADECINKIKPLYVRKYEIETRELLSSFPSLLSFHVHNEDNSDSFVNWVTGWLSGYYQAYLKIKDMVATKTSIKNYIDMDNDSLERKIQEKYEELAFYPSMMAYNTGVERIEVDIVNDMLSKCASIAISEKIKISNLYAVNNFSFKIKQDGIIQSALNSINDMADIKGMIPVANLLDIPNKLMSQKSLISTPNALLGVLIGKKIGLVIQGKMLTALAAKGFMGKTSVFFFKAGANTFVQAIGLSAVSKVIASKAAAAVGGKLLILIAERAVGVVVTTVSFGLGVIFDYGLSEAIKAATVNGLTNDIMAQNSEILKSVETSLFEEMKKRIDNTSDLFRSELRTQLIPNAN